MILLRWFYIYMAVVRMGFTIDEENSTYAGFRMTLLAVFILFSTIILAPAFYLLPGMSGLVFALLGLLVFVLSLGLPYLLLNRYGLQYSSGIEIKWYHIAITWTVIIGCIIILAQAISFSALYRQRHLLSYGSVL